MIACLSTCDKKKSDHMHSLMQECELTPNSKLSFRLYDSFDSLPKEALFKYHQDTDVYRHVDFIEPLAQHMNYFYVSVSYQNECVAVIPLQIVDLESSGMDSLFKDTRFRKSLYKILDRTPRRLLICGNLFVCDEFCVSPTLKAEFKDLENELLRYIEQVGQGVDAILFKDFYSKDKSLNDNLRGLDFHEISTQPNMRIVLSAEWKGFEDYLQDMKAKFRTKAKAALLKSKDLEVKELSASELKDNIHRLEALYRNVEAKADFVLAKFNMNTFLDWKERLGDRFFVKAYIHDGSIIAFMSGFVTEEAIDAHFVGIDYTYNKSFAVYQRILYDYIASGIDRKVNVVNFSRTASEIKSTVGAMPQETYCYVKLTNRFLNLCTGIVLKNIQSTEATIRTPFKQAYYSSIVKTHFALS